MTLIEQLDCDRARLVEILNLHRELQLPGDSNVPVATLYKLYIDYLEDSLETLNLMTEYLRKPA